MRWRLLGLNWRYGVGELVIVVAGVIIALAFDQWNSDRLDRVEEAEIIGRFLVDLQSDLDDISLGLDLISRKEAALSRVSSSLEGPVDRPTELSRFLEDIVTASNYGWDQHHARRLTFDEVLASGKFGLIRDTTVRLRISDYYETAISRETRIDERETGYSQLSYRLVPRHNGGGTVMPGLSDSQQSKLADQALRSLEPGLVAAELNFARFANARFMEWKSAALELADELDSYRAALGYD